jgi:plasmid stabilization system protein ParE
MSLRLRIRPEAEQDLEDAAAWYAEQRPGLGQELLDEALWSFQQIAEQPRFYPIVHRDTRRALLRRFPFGVFYRIEPDFIVVVAVMHGSRDPQRWKQRT